jgi:replicative DNA helicase
MTTTQRRQVSSEIFDRMPPVDLEAEKAVLGSMLISNAAADEVILHVSTSDFYDDANRRIFAHLVDMAEAAQPSDVALLVDRLKRAGDFEAVGGASYLAKIGRSVPNAAHGAYYARIVRRKAQLRALIEASTENLRDAYEDSEDPEALIERLEQRVFEIADQRISGNLEGATNVADALRNAMEQLEARLEHSGTAGVSTGFRQLDNLLGGGLRAQELTIVGGRPSHGKTALGVQLARASSSAQHPTLVFSLEMSETELVERLLSQRTQVNLHRMRSGTISSEDRRQVVEAAGLTSQLPLWICDEPNLSVGQIAARCRRQRRRHGLELVLIDYIQLIRPDDERISRQEQVSKISRRLKILARELDCPVVILAQVNRTAGDVGRAPRLSELRESGALEQDADAVIFVHRPGAYLTDREKNERYTDAATEHDAEIHLAKQRNGPTGQLTLVWRKYSAQFLEAAASDTSEATFWDQEDEFL